MKKSYILVISLFFILSCAATKKTTKTENSKLINQLLDSNKNVFYASSTHIIISYIWSYSENGITLYKLKKGKIINKEVCSTDKQNLMGFPTKEDYFELDKCLELDGDMLCIIIKDGASVNRKDLPINLNCFAQGGYKLNFFNKIAKDMMLYKIDMTLPH